MSIQQIIKGEGQWPVYIWTDECDEKSKQQLTNVAQLPFINHHIAAMADVHVGRGATIGSVIATTQAIIPAAVGVDLGCGMIACRLSLNANDIDEQSILKIYNQIHRDVPVGRNQHQSDRALTDIALPFEAELKGIIHKHPKLRKAFRNFDNWIYQMGTLGSGNHFIEICIDEAQHVWVMLHSGSRGIGNAIGTYFIERAKKDMLKWDVHLPDTDLAYLQEGSVNFDDYIEAVNWAQRYAYQNRQAMLDLVLAGMHRHLQIPFTVTREVVNCHHNYVAREHHFGVDSWVTRKGAIRAGIGEMGIIPGSMGAKSYIVRGKGNPDSFCSCAHGAGRKMSRTEARHVFTVEDLKQQTAGVQCNKDNSVLDEIPGAYKDIDTVMANQDDLVEVVHTLKQIITIKG